MAKNGYNKTAVAIGAVIVYVILGFTIIIPLLVTKFVLDSFFNKRVKDSDALFTEKDYKGLIKEEKHFKSGKYTLGGGLFYNEQFSSYKGLIIVSHGIGCGLNNYMLVIDYFARKGYLVFAFNMTGTCTSEGPGLIGLQRGILDLKNAIFYAKSLPQAKGLKTFVFAHSWSGFCSAAMLNDKKVCKELTAVATTSGFNNFWDSMRAQAEAKAGKATCLAKPSTYVISFLRFGKVAFYEGIKGINKFNKPVLITHSKDDPTVPFEISLANHMDKCTNKKAIVNIYEDRAHSIHRAKWAEEEISKSVIGKPVIEKPADMNIFQYYMEIKYRYTTADVEFALDEEYMNSIEAFFDKARKEEEIA